MNSSNNNINDKTNNLTYLILIKRDTEEGMVNNNTHVDDE